MSTEPPYPDEQPTTRIPAPAAPVRARVPAGPPVAETAVVDALAVDRLAAAISSLRTMLAFVGVISLAALALGAYALHKATQDDGKGASRARVARLDDRVTRLSRQVQSTRASSGTSASASEVSALQKQVNGAAKASDVQKLSDSVAKLSAASSSAGGSGTNQSTAISTLSQRVDKLSQQVQTLQQSSGSGSQTQTTP